MILDKIVQLPVATWQYAAEDAMVRHIGPMAQDFHAAFNFGGSATSITTNDADGVAFAAIQGLYQLIQDKDAKIGAQARELEKYRAAIGCGEACSASDYHDVFDIGDSRHAA